MTKVKVNCKNCGSQFEREVKRGRPQTWCERCREAKATGSLPSKIDVAVVKLILMDGVTCIENVEPCRDCGTTFIRPRKRGRPPTRCPDCQEAFKVEQAGEPIGQEKLAELYSGSTDKLKGTPQDLPKGNEAQCPLVGCGRIFTSDSACELHKRYGGPVTTCVDPMTIGMEPRERRGLPIWTRPSEPKKLGD